MELQQHSLFQSVWRYYQRRGVLLVQHLDAECWNVPSADEPDPPLVPRTNGHFDVEGIRCADIAGCFSLDFTKLSDCKLFIRACLEWLWDSIDLRSWEYFWGAHPFHFPWSQWCWTISSLQDVRFEMALNRVAKGRYRRRNKVVDLGLIANKISDSEAVEWLCGEGGFIPAGDSLWVSRHDPTVICADERKIPFDLRQGWSYDRLNDILKLWCRAMGLVDTDIIIQNKKS